MRRRDLLAWAALLPLLVLNLFPFAVMLDVILDLRGSDAGGWLGFWAGMWQRTELGTALLNSLVVSLATAAASVLLAFPAAYALSRFRFAGRRAVSEALLGSQMLSPIVLVLGLSQMVSAVGLTDTRIALVSLYVAFQVPFAVWMLRGYIDAIPKDVEEAARLDGASQLRVFASIVVPLSIPAIAVTATFAFITAWTEFALALTLLRSPANFTLPLRVNALTAGRYAVDWGDVMAAILVTTIPVLMMFAAMQKYILRGLHIDAGDAP